MYGLRQLLPHAGRATELKKLLICTNTTGGG